VYHLVSLGPSIDDTADTVITEPPKAFNPSSRALHVA